MNKQSTFRRRKAFPSILEKMPFQFIESYNSIRTNIRFTSVNKNYKKIVITSAVSSEGKSTVSINLAVSLANTSSRLLLIDSDLRKPSLHKFLQTDNNAPGLSTALAGFCEIGQCIVHVDEANFDFIPAGPVPPNPAELLGSSKISEIMDLLAQRYDYILLDTSPASLVTDAALLSKISDGVVFVVKHHYTTIDEASEAIHSLEKVGATIIGLVLNDFKSKKSSRAYSSSHYKGYSYGYQSQLPLKKAPGEHKAAAGK